LRSKDSAFVKVYFVDLVCVGINEDVFQRLVSLLKVVLLCEKAEIDPSVDVFVYAARSRT